MTEFDMYPADAQIKQFVLHKVQVGTRLRVDSYTAQQMKLSGHEEMDRILGDLVYSLTSAVLQDKLPPTNVTETKSFTSRPTPATWWDHFKHDNFTTWWFWAIFYVCHRWIKPPKYVTDTKNVTLTVDLERWINYTEALNVPDSFGPKYHGYNLETDWVIRNG